MSPFVASIWLDELPASQGLAPDGMGPDGQRFLLWGDEGSEESWSRQQREMEAVGEL